MKQKLFAFDVDGTLVDHTDHTIPQSTQIAINQLKKQGHIVGVCTGRNTRQFNRVLHKSDFDFVVLVNGGYLEIDGKVIKTFSNTYNQKDRLVTLFKKHNLEYGCATEDHLYAVNPMSEKVQWLITNYDVDTPEQRDDLRDLDIYQYTIYEDATTIELINEIDDEFVFHTHGGEFCYDIVRKDVNKGIMLKEVANIFNIDMKDTYAFGDSDNDIEFLEMAGMGVALGSGTKTAKDAADYITTEVYNDGIYNALVHLGYIK